MSKPHALADHPSDNYNRPVTRNSHAGRSAKPTAGDSIYLATLFGLLAALGYTAANVCLRAVTAVDPYWVSAVKAVPTVVIFAPWMLVRLSRGERNMPPTRVMFFLIATALIGQVGGNVVFQWALGQIGIALTVPLCLGTLIISGAWLGRVILGEPITVRNVASMVFLISAITVLSLGAPLAHESLASDKGNSALMVSLGVLAACVSGVAYGVLGVAIRHAAREGTPHTTTLVTVGLAGVVVLWPMAWARMGTTQMLATDPRSLVYMIGAGLANAAAFFALTKSLKMSSIVHVNALNATQAAMAAIAGVLLFGEPLSMALGVGVFLTALGLGLMEAPRPSSTSSKGEEKPSSAGQSENGREATEGNDGQRDTTRIPTTSYD